jgi:hypothetical protein
MTTFQPVSSKLSRTFSLIKQAIKGGHHDFTTESIRRAVLLLAIPMMLEMAMESVFALVDLYFVGHLPYRICTNHYLFARYRYEYGCNGSCRPQGR